MNEETEEEEEEESIHASLRLITLALRFVSLWHHECTVFVVSKQSGHQLDDWAITIR
jgi:hypothetical protein